MNMNVLLTFTLGSGKLFYKALILLYLLQLFDSYELLKEKKDFAHNTKMNQFF